jgi:hypothetical protein
MALYGHICDGMGGGIPRELPKDFDTVYSPSAQVASSEPSRKDHVSNVKAEEQKHQEAQSSDTVGKYFKGDSPVLFGLVVAVLAGGLLTGAIIWWRSAAKCRK